MVFSRLQKDLEFLLGLGVIRPFFQELTIGFRMKLKSVVLVAITKGLIGAGQALCQTSSTLRNFKSVVVPMKYEGLGLKRFKERVLEGGVQETNGVPSHLGEWIFGDLASKGARK
jgi:hypothetical protein